MFVFPVPPKDIRVVIDPDGPILEGSSVILSCTSRANPPVTNYTVYKDVEEDKEPGPLIINSVDLSHSGDYHCTAENELGEDISEAVQLDVECKFILHTAKALIYTDDKTVCFQR